MIRRLFQLLSVNQRAPTRQVFTEAAISIAERCQPRTSPPLHRRPSAGSVKGVQDVLLPDSAPNPAEPRPVQKARNRHREKVRLAFRPQSR